MAMKGDGPSKSESSRQLYWNGLITCLDVTHGKMITRVYTTLPEASLEKLLASTSHQESPILLESTKAVVYVSKSREKEVNQLKIRLASLSELLGKVEYRE